MTVDKELRQFDGVLSAVSQGEEGSRGVKLVRPLQSLLSDTVLIKLLGEGGCGEAWLVDYCGQRLVLKKSLPRMPTLGHEASVLYNLDGAGGVPRLFGVSHDASCLVMDYCPGKTLDEHLDTKFTDPLLYWLSVFRSLARNLSAIHDAGFVHNDLHTENVIIDGDHYAQHAPPTVYIIDFDGADIPKCVDGNQSDSENSDCDDDDDWCQTDGHDDWCTPAHDVHSLGRIMRDVFGASQTVNQCTDLVDLVKAMSLDKAKHRPSLDYIIKKLDEILGH